MISRHDALLTAKRGAKRIVPRRWVPAIRRIGRPLTETPANVSSVERAHPLPTLNLAGEAAVGDTDNAADAGRFLRFAADESVVDRVVDRISDQVRAFMCEIGFPDRSYSTEIHEFLRTIENNPAAGARRTTATGSLLWLHLLTVTLEPEVIVESGVFRGASLHTLFHAGRGATVHAFDIDLSNLNFTDPAIQFHEGDWAERLPTARSGNDLCYFDDHINNCLRIRQAYDQGFRHIVFDDSPDIGQLHSWRYPGVPTVQMVVNETLEPGESVEWIWKDRKLSYTFDEADTHGVKDLIESMAELPSLTRLTGRRTGVQTYVRLTP